jgi:hypothetical protein
MVTYMSGLSKQLNPYYEYLGLIARNPKRRRKEQWSLS